MVVRFIFGLLTVGLLALTTFERSAVWQSEKALWAEAVRLSPKKPRPHLNLGLEFEKRGDYVLAMREFELARAWSLTLNRMPKHQRMSQAAAESNISLLLLVQGRFRDARDMASHAIEVYPEIRSAYLNRGTANLALGYCGLAVLDYARVGVPEMPRC